MAAHDARANFPALSPAPGAPLSVTPDAVAKAGFVEFAPWHNHHHDRAPGVPGDDRFTFPPVPGYTGFVPRSREHFGKSYAVTTLAALQSFEHMNSTKERLPPKTAAIGQAIQNTPVWVGGGNAKSGAGSHGAGPVWLNATAAMRAPVAGAALTTSTSEAQAAPARGPPEAVVVARIRQNNAAAAVPTGRVATDLQKRQRAGELQAQCSSDHRIPGTTTFIPRERSRFGEQYQKSAAAAMVEFKALDRNYDQHLRELERDGATLPGPAAVAAVLASAKTVEGRAGVATTTDPQHVHWLLYGSKGGQNGPALASPAKAKPTGPPPGTTSTSKYIPGYTGNPGRQGFKNESRAMDIGAFATPDPEMVTASGLPPKDLAVNSPIPGYKGFLPLYQTCGERSFGQSSKKCISEFKNMLHDGHTSPGAATLKMPVQGWGGAASGAAALDQHGLEH
ncbi:hypothetical protein GGF32_010110 [Allomyces javanicus]|nr:hypothetical protein GGF32_010110 [Allomyces javanicus]